MSLATLLTLLILGLAIYGAFQLFQNLRRALLEKRSAQLQEEKDEREFWEYDGKHKKIRAQFDPHNSWNEATSLPTEYVLAIKRLNREYKQVLKRRNGWEDKDFEDSTR